MPFLAEKHSPIPHQDLVSWMLDNPSFDQDKPIYVDVSDPSRSISHRQARVIVRKLVAGLRAAGLKPGDCVCLASFNDIWYSMLFVGIVAAGGVFTGTNPSYTKFELVHHIKTAQAKFFISEPELLDGVLTAAKECGIPNSRVWILDALKQAVPDGFESFQKLMTYGEEDWVRFDDEETCKNTTAARLFSSGTTGLPKAAVITHRNLIAQHTIVHELSPKPFEIKRLLVLPMFHAAIVPVAHTSALRSGVLSYVMRRFDLEQYLSTVEKHQITELSLVPPITIAIIMSPLQEKYSLKCVKLAGCGAGALSKESQARLAKLLAPDAACSQVWGMTETCCVATRFHHYEHDTTGSVGRVISNCDVKLVDDDGKDITGDDTLGELCIRGPTITPGYFDHPAANAEAFDDEGYFKTGDIMYRDKTSQKWYIVDRKKELIKVRGFQVAPPEIEAVLLTHPQIVDAAVIAVTKRPEPLVELPRAYVVRRPGEEGLKLNEADVKKYCSERLAKYKELTGGVVLVDAIPKNASGKHLKRILREEAKIELWGEKAKI